MSIHSSSLVPNKPVNTFVLVALLVILQSSTGHSQCPAASDSAPDRVVLLQVYGRERISCKSRWHDIRLNCGLDSHLEFSSEDQKTLVPKFELSADDEWKIDQGFCSRITAQFKKNLKTTPENRARYANWTGSTPTPDPIDVQTTLNARVTHIEDDIALVKVAGVIQWTESGKLANRFGPNWWETTWRMKPDFELVVDLKKQSITSIKLGKTLGTIKGRYHGGKGRDDLNEPFSGIVQLRGEVIQPLTDAQREQLLALVRKLESSDFAERQKVSAAIGEYGRSAHKFIQKLCEQETDAETIARLRAILVEF